MDYGISHLKCFPVLANIEQGPCIIGQKVLFHRDIPRMAFNVREATFIHFDGSMTFSRCFMGKVSPGGQHQTIFATVGTKNISDTSESVLQYTFTFIRPAFLCKKSCIIYIHEILLPLSLIHISEPT